MPLLRRSSAAHTRTRYLRFFLVLFFLFTAFRGYADDSEFNQLTLSTDNFIHRVLRPLWKRRRSGYIIPDGCGAEAVELAETRTCRKCRRM